MHMARHRARHLIRRAPSMLRPGLAMRVPRIDTSAGARCALYRRNMSTGTKRFYKRVSIRQVPEPPTLLDDAGVDEDVSAIAKPAADAAIAQGKSRTVSNRVDFMKYLSFDGPNMFSFSSTDA